MEELIKCLSSSIEAINKFLNTTKAKTIKQRLNEMLAEGNFGSRFNKCSFKKQLTFINRKALICKELKLIVVYGAKPTQEQERMCRARRFILIYVNDKHSIKQLEKELVNNELI